VFLKLADVSFAAHEPERAATWLEIADWFGIRRAETALLKARSARLRGKAGEVEAALQEATRRGALPADVQRQRILAAAQSGQLAVAGPYLARLLTDTNYDNKDVCVAYISGYLRTQRLGEARQLLETLLLDSPEDPWPLVVRGRVSMQQSDLAGAERDFLAALQLSADHPEATVRLGDLLRDTHRVDEAAIMYRRVVGHPQFGVTAAIGLSTCLKSSGDFSGAAKLLRDVVAQSPDHPEALLELGRVESESGNHAEAVIHLERCVQQQPWLVDARYLLAQALRMLRRESDAAPHFDYVDRARASRVELQALTEQIQKSPRDTQLLVRMGELLSQFGDPQEAMEVLQTVIDLDPGQKAAHRILSELLLKTSPGDAEVRSLSDWHRQLSEANDP
jgi:tetratricopeptide (TPR) repeat protein